MSLIKSLRKFFPFIAIGAQVAEGATTGNTQAGIGIAFDTANAILNHPQYGGDAEAAHADAIRANALAIDDHEADIKALQAQIAALTGNNPPATGSPQIRDAGQPQPKDAGGGGGK